MDHGQNTLNSKVKMCCSSEQLSHLFSICRERGGKKKMSQSEWCKRIAKALKDNFKRTARLTQDDDDEGKFGVLSSGLVKKMS